VLGEVGVLELVHEEGLEVFLSHGGVSQLGWCKTQVTVET
jgi:hypothetical protein